MALACQFIEKIPKWVCLPSGQSLQHLLKGLLNSVAYLQRLLLIVAIFLSHLDLDQVFIDIFTDHNLHQKGLKDPEHLLIETDLNRITIHLLLNLSQPFTLR